MDYEHFVTIVERQTGSPREAAETAIRATLETLAERFTPGEARHLVDHVPEELIPWLFTDHGRQAFDVDDFLARVAKREGVDVATAGWHARVVFGALRRTLSADELADLVADLPHDLEPLVCGTAIVAADEFVRTRPGQRTRQ